MQSRTESELLTNLRFSWSMFLYSVQTTFRSYSKSASLAKLYWGRVQQLSLNGPYIIVSLGVFEDFTL